MTTATSSRPANWRRVAVDHPAAVATATIVAAAVAIMLFTPDMVTGSEHDHLPLAGFLGWVWALVAIAHVHAVGRTPAAKAALSRRVLWIVGTWVIAAALCIAGPVLVTGTDPTRLPLTGFAAPILAAFATTYLCVLAARDGSASA